MLATEHNVLAVLISFIASFPPVSGKNVGIGVHAYSATLILIYATDAIG